ncbi:hypothetical protein RirG_204860 [Rhizophagus irregularis DAOM 197198w]|uniref:TLDc domain-containing protein n=2 Tax=Rhizophagus irregularis TaxID=588596 RepID=A0A015ITU9_RHIIW|nr:hypothetical protein RirG_204860 [Rhizophagus irregularis DAOM 197198w]
MSLECLQEVANDYEKLLQDGKGYDVIIYASENEEIRAHSLVLSTSFIYCGRINLTTLEGPELLKLSIAVDDLNIRTLFPQIEDYLFKNKSTYLHQNAIEILETIYQRESFTKLWNFCLDKVYKEPKILFEADRFANLKVPLVELVFQQTDLNLDEIIEILSNYDKFDKLKEPLSESLFKRNDLNLDKIVIMLFNSDKFIKLKAPLLELILKRDDLILEEIIVWNSLLKWGLAQNSSISQDSTRWNEEEIKIMERTIHRFIPLVRFYDMPPGDFLDKIYPLKHLLPIDLVNSLLTFHIMPDRRSNIDLHPSRKPKFDSVIIQPKHLSIFASWIDKKGNFHYNVMNTPYKFNLLYRANRDGNTPEGFHAKCDNKGATIIVVKIQNSEHMVGGYNPLFWDSSNSNKSTKDSFIFSFTDRNNLQTAKVGYIKDGRYENAVYSSQNYGPRFGGGHDLWQFNNLNNNNNTWGINNPYSYSKIDTPEEYNINSSYKIFNMENYEVFQVVRK